MFKKFNPYAHPSLGRDKTMYLSTLRESHSSKRKFQRESSFQLHDIEGASPKKRIRPKINSPSYNLSTEVQVPPGKGKKLQRQADPLFIGDIEGAKAVNKDFRTKRVVNPLNPEYVLPSVVEVQPDKGRPFIRDNLQTYDINQKKRCRTELSLNTTKPTIEGSSPRMLAREVKAISRLDVKDINRSTRFTSSRITNPLSPNYLCPGDRSSQFNVLHGQVKGFTTIESIGRDSCKDRHLDIQSIESAKNKPFFSNYQTIQKRRQFKSFMRQQEIQNGQGRDRTRLYRDGHTFND